MTDINVLRQIIRQESPSRLMNGVVIGTDARGTRTASVRVSGGRVHTRVYTCDDELQIDDEVIIARLESLDRLVVIGKIATKHGSKLSRMGTLAPPDSFTALSFPGATYCQWDTYPGEDVSWEIEHALEADKSDSASVLVSRGSYYIYPCDPGTTVYFRARALRWLGSSNMMKSAWCAWESVVAAAYEVPNLIITLTNKSGGQRVATETVIVDTGNAESFTTTTAESDIGVVGVVMETIADDAEGLVCISGYCQVLIDNSVSVGHYLEACTVAGRAQGVATRGAGTFARALTSGTQGDTVWAIVTLGMVAGGGSTPPPGNEGEALIANAVPAWIADLSPLWLGTHTWGSSFAVMPTDQTGQDLGDATHRWDLHTQDVHFEGATGDNSITIPDGLADALNVVDSGATVFLQLDTDNNYFLIDPAAAGINVGIGIAAPAYPLDVSAAWGATFAAHFENTSQGAGVSVGGVYIKINDNDTADTVLLCETFDGDVFRVKGDGCVVVYDELGIGIATPGYPLEIRGAQQDADQVLARMGANDAGGNLKALDIHVTAGTPEVLLTTAATGVDPRLSFSVAGVAAQVTLISSGNVGIGTVTPAGFLHIYSTVNAGRGVIIDAQGAGNQQSASINLLTFGTGAVDIGNAACTGWHLVARGNAYVTAADRHDMFLYFWNGSAFTNVMTWEYTGNVGIGTVTPGAKLDIEDDALSTTVAVLEILSPFSGINQTNSGIFFSGVQNANQNVTIAFGNNPSTDTNALIAFDSVAGWRSNIHFFVNNAGATRTLAQVLAAGIGMTIQNDGKVGIGIAAPTAGLHVDTASTPIKFRRSGGSGTGILSIDNAMTGSQSDVTYTADPDGAGAGGHAFYVDTGAATNFAMGIDKDGNVGIGTTSPDNLLEVHGMVEIQVDDGDCPLRFHDPLDYWFTMGIDRSEGGLFKINAGGTVGAQDHFTMSAGGYVGMGVASPATRLDIGAGAMQYLEMASPGNGPANTARIFCTDLAGKTTLYVIFPTGGPILIRTEA